MLRWCAAALCALLLVACGSGRPATPTPEPSIEYKLAAIHGDLSAEAAFGAILDTLQEGNEICAPEPDREHAADVIVASWEQSGKQDSLLDWARTVSSICE